MEINLLDLAEYMYAQLLLSGMTVHIDDIYALLDIQLEYLIDTGIIAESSIRYRGDGQDD